MQSGLSHFCNDQKPDVEAWAAKCRRCRPGLPLMWPTECSTRGEVLTAALASTTCSSGCQGHRCIALAAMRSACTSSCTSYLGRDNYFNCLKEISISGQLRKEESSCRQQPAAASRRAVTDRIAASSSALRARAEADQLFTIALMLPELIPVKVIAAEYGLRRQLSPSKRGCKTSRPSTTPLMHQGEERRACRQSG